MLQVAILARNEERRIGGLIDSLPLDRPDTRFHLLVKGSNDRTADCARERTATAANFDVHDLPFGGKARTWNHFVDQVFDGRSDTVFTDGDVVLARDALEALVDTAEANPGANAISAAPSTGRHRETYLKGIQAENGLFGGLYLLRGGFLARLKTSGIRLPFDLIGDDGLIGALAKTDLQNEANWRGERIAFCAAASFACERVELASPASLRLQSRRMLNYSLRRYQNLLISRIMRGPGPRALPTRLAELYTENMPLFTPRLRPDQLVFDLLALRRIRRLAA